MEHRDAPASDVRYRKATARDAEAVARVHADSWRRHYRGAYRDAYLDGDVVSDRLAVWQGRLASPRSNQHTVVADRRGEVIGFVHTVFDHDPQWGALVDNLHVRSDLKGGGIGTRLLSEAAGQLLRARPSSSLYLWVLGQNTAAQSFYEARGGTRVETEVRGPFPGGGSAVGHRYAWPDPTRLRRPEGS
jgi:ribosomal protein S18 acetylase RimI-like enzyme